MTIESVTYIDDLDPNYPDGNDPKSEGDNHIRNLKTGIKNTFPKIDAAVSASAAEINKLIGLEETVTEKFSQFSASISAINTAVNNYSASLSNINSRVTTLSASVSAINTLASNLSSSISQLWVRSGELSASISQLWVRSGELSASISQIWAQVSSVSGALSSRITTLSNSVSALNTTINTHSASISAMDALLKSHAIGNRVAINSIWARTLSLSTSQEYLSISKLGTGGTIAVASATGKGHNITPGVASYYNVQGMMKIKNNHYPAAQVNCSIVNMAGQTKASNIGTETEHPSAIGGAKERYFNTTIFLSAAESIRFQPSRSGSISNDFSAVIVLSDFQIRRLY